MKNKFKILFIILFTGLKLLAQTDEFKPEYSFGIKQGVNYSSVILNPGISQGVTLGYTGGLVYKFRNEKTFGLQLELNYFQKGWTEDLDTISNSYKRVLTYIELPLITQIILGKRPNFKYCVNLGTSFAYLLSDKEDFTVNNELYRREYYEKEIENAFDYSVLGEFGIMYNTKIGEFQMGIRYQFTFTDLFKVTSDTQLKGSQNQVWCFSISYFFLDNKD